MSYDEVDALGDFASTHGITYSLLSDPDSEVIRRFGILNTLIPEDDHPWFGVPFPGVYVTDGDGVITQKFFEHHFAMHPSAAQLLRAAHGEHVELERASQTTPAEVTVDVSFDADTLSPYMLHDLDVSFDVPAGQHLYGEPVSTGMVATTVAFDENPGLIIRAPIAPPTHAHTLAGTGDVLHIYDGSFSIRVPIAHNGSTTIELDDGSRVINIAGTIRWQSCDDETCGLPQQQRFSFQVQGLPMLNYEIDVKPSGAPDLDSNEHFKRMVLRHLPATQD